ncbi:class A beta-lactamase-related serine hydrolase [bacterium]|nr:MAG: class A beta-lactamase-related serine hydrolase [bacterium]
MHLRRGARLAACVGRGARCRRAAAGAHARLDRRGWMIDLPRAEAALRAHAGARFTAAALRVERGGAVAERAVGELQPGGAPAQGDSLFDYASLTKLFVATAALRLVARGALALDAPVAPWLPRWRQARAGATLRMLLAHTAGLRSGVDVRTLADGDVLRYALEAELAAAPGERVIYSDLGFILLGKVVERAAGTALADVVRREVLEPLGASTGVGYLPPATLRRRIAVTERCAWRGRLMHGEVHDEKCFAMGGVAGHAGIFGDAATAAALGRTYLEAGRAVLLPAELSREAIGEQAWDPILRRGLGWALRTSEENSCGRYWSADTFGHTGFTGTCIWVDPQRDLVVVLLTNSVYVDRSDTRAFRQAVFEGALLDTEPAATQARPAP